MRLTHSPRTRTTTQVLIAGLIGISMVVAIDAARTRPVDAAPGDGITAYISPPFVQGPPSNTNAVIQDFNASNFCSNLGASNVGTFSGSCTSPQTPDPWGGANTTSDQPTVGGTPSRFAAAWASGGTPQVLTLDFAANNEARYIGFWWSAGSANNQVRIYNKVNGSDVLAATFTTNTLNLLLNTSGQAESSVLPPHPYPGSAMVTAIDGSQYNKGHYFGRPADHTTLTPTALPLGLTRSNINDNIYSHAYLNVYASGSIAFSRIEFVGGGFEIDNLAVSAQNVAPSQELVLVQSVLGKSVEFRANGGTGSMPAQTSNSTMNLSTNVFTRVGYAFAGWSTSPTGSVEYADAAQYGFGSDLILYALWTANPVTTTTAVNAAPSSPTTVATPAPTTPGSDIAAGASGSAPVSELPSTGRNQSMVLLAAWMLALGLLLRHRARLHG